MIDVDLKYFYPFLNRLIYTIFYSIGGIAGFLGSFIDSVMGATLQYSGINKKTGAIIEKPPQDSNSVIHITGTNILDNHEVNLLSSLVTTFLVPPISASL